MTPNLTNTLLIAFSTTIVGTTIAFLTTLIVYAYHSEIQQYLLRHGLIIPNRSQILLQYVEQRRAEALQPRVASPPEQNSSSVRRRSMMTVHRESSEEFAQRRVEPTARDHVPRIPLAQPGRDDGTNWDAPLNRDIRTV
ncbi:hypothetical protein ARMGADRAFT_1081992 [Armillaria gallica]|uniref:Uncharacterized protein n=1 Tax=Armillaria gallica TaxID=47427 RepID=A0A2H3D7J7_ARMGA|nr:hypothetical protein ARMGADRAFT_1081992 [Armillaria gallica]